MKLKSKPGIEGKTSFPDGSTADNTKRKAPELTSEESEKRYKELMDFLPQPVFEMNLKGEIVLSNRAGDDFFGPLPGNHDEKLSALNCFVKEDIPRIIENFKKSAMGIETEPGEFTAIKKDGTLCPVMVFGSPIIRNNKITGRRGIIIDISERKNYEVSLLNAKNELEKIRKIEVLEIAYFYVLDKGVYMRTFQGNSYSIEYTLEKLESILSPSSFFRINRKYFVNMDSIANMVAYSRGRVKLDLKPAADDELDTVVSIDRSAEFRKWMNS